MYTKYINFFYKNILVYTTVEYAAGHVEIFFKIVFAIFCLYNGTFLKHTHQSSGL